jgi:hypothetical protein
VVLSGIQREIRIPAKSMLDGAGVAFSHDHSPLKLVSHRGAEQLPEF